MNVWAHVELGALTLAVVGNSVTGNSRIKYPVIIGLQIVPWAQ